MADETGAPETQGEDDATAHGATPPAQGANPQAQGAAGDTGEAATVESLQAKIAELLADNAQYRKRDKQREDAEKAKALAEASEVERLTATNAELTEQLTAKTAQLQEQSLRLDAMSVITRLGFKNPEMAYRWLSAETITYDDDGTPTNVEALLTGLAKADPSLVVTTDFGGGNRGQSAAAGADMNSLIRRSIGH